MRRPWVIIGCGYTGARLAERLIARGARVIATCRDQAAARQAAARLGGGAQLRAADLAEPGSLAGWIPRGAVVVDTAPPGPLGPAAEEALVAAAAASGAHRIVYLSSTGVYGAAGGAWVDEDTPTAPLGPHGERRLAAESALLAAAAAARTGAVALRIAAIYGPGRGVQARLARGEYRVVGAGDTYVSRIHVDDLVAAILAAGAARSLPRPLYTVSDGAPMTARDYADRVAALLGLPPPPSVAPAEISATARAMATANRRVSNRRLVAELGVALTYPDGVAGARQAIAAERAAADGAT